MLPEFQPFAKIPRISRECVVTEKIDGTNAQIFIDEYGGIFAGSRKRWLTPGKGDNCGFAAWVEACKGDLEILGPGRHFGEWWGKGIQRNYGMNRKLFSLFNVVKWEQGNLPACLDVVPVLYEGPFVTDTINLVVERLSITGSVAAPGFMDPEGIVIYHKAGGYLFKKMCKNDEQRKSDAPR